VAQRLASASSAQGGRQWRAGAEVAVKIFELPVLYGAWGERGD
jgi:hypothetical protein